ncbi:XRE family transcriptional regulator [Maribellus maritimus]|uniref:XRE family transcriptional regulator n=1 Tax=Maribellus maritimus TaxID=2870838 RepID=UPI001EEA4472|nr:XRE family transcriptional regulator [Maribellus maritimus]MCG6190199.1 helix-turn-helix domain-containing protein [Maribellus maritimus]
MKNWKSHKYQRISNAKIKDDYLVVEFENGDIENIRFQSFIADNIDSSEIVSISNNQFEIILKTKDDDIIIPWDKIRIISDIEFARFVAEKAEEQALQIGKKIKVLRERKQIKSNELAKRTGLTPQTISRIEKGHTDVNFKTLRKILASMGYSLGDLANQESITENSEKSLSVLLHKLSNIGIDRNLLYSKILPKRIVNTLEEFSKDVPELLLNEISVYLSQVFGWQASEIWSSKELRFQPEPIKNVYYKTQLKSNINQVKAYTHYAYFIAKTILKGCDIEKKYDYPQDIEEFKSMFYNKFSILNFNNILKFTWDLGIYVFPLSDSGVFHGAAWNLKGRHVIVLKQKDNSNARWVFDLLHELYHVFTHLEKENTSYVEFDEINLILNNENIEEREANAFANQIIFSGKEEDLVQKCIKDADWKIENLKRSVVKIAKEENIGIDFLANYLARRLEFQGENWWGTAQNLQITSPRPVDISSKVVVGKIKREKLLSFENELLERALKI